MCAPPSANRLSNAQTSLVATFSSLQAGFGDYKEAKLLKKRPQAYLRSPY